MLKDDINEYEYEDEIDGMKWEMKKKKYGMIIGIGG
jgi:hypothetical protein